MSAPGLLPLRLLLVKYLADQLAMLRKDDLLSEASAELPSGSRVPVLLGGRLAGFVTMPKGSVSASVTDEAALLAWARKHHPDKVETVPEVAVDDDVIALVAEHLPDRLREVPRVRPAWVSDLLAGMKAGRYVTKAGDILAEVPGITVSTSVPAPRVNLEKDAGEIIGAAWRAGQVPVADLLALPTGEGGAER